MFDSTRWLLSKDKKFLDSVNMAMKMIAWAVPALVTGLKLKHLGLGNGELFRVVESTPVTSWLMGLSLVLFYSSWILGAYFDLGMQKEVYVIPPGQKLRLRDLGVMFAVAVTFGVLGFFLDRPAIFSTVLLVYWIVNIVAWRYLVTTIIIPIQAGSVQRHGSDSRFMDLAKLASVTDYMEGSWQWWRFATGGIIATGMLVIAVSEAHSVVQQAGVSIPVPLILAVMFFLFVLIVESWMWLKRFATILRLACFDSIGGEYDLLPRAETRPAAAAVRSGDGALSPQ